MGILRPLLLLLLLLLLLMCGISADFCPSLACLSICLQVKLCISQAADRRHGRTDVETPRHLHRIISYCCVIAIYLYHYYHIHTETSAYQYPNHTYSNTSYSTRSSLVCWSLSFLSS